MNLKMDLSQDGLKMFFRDYELEALKIVWRSNPGMISRDVWEQVNLSHSISRASIINFLNDMVELGLLKASEETGKGGYRSRYSPRYGEAELKQFLADSVKAKLDQL